MSWDLMTPEEEARLTEKVIAASQQLGTLELAKRCLMVAVTRSDNQVVGDIRRAIITLFGPEIDAQLQSEFNKPL